MKKRVMVNEFEKDIEKESRCQGRIPFPPLT
jgi:hypothetical protein